MLQYLSLTAAVVATLGALTLWNRAEVERAEQSFIQAQLTTVVETRRVEIEGLFNDLYRNLRTISLLPSIRGIQGTNRNNEDEDVVAERRLTMEGSQTVQQIYNNLVASVSVSEVYAVIEGLDRRKGQVPFFMYDKLAFGEAKPADEKPNSVDAPEESEEEEYTHFPKQMAAIRASHPRFDFVTQDQVPAYLSPLMRTCDNTQYLSKANDDVANARGLLYSVPFYSLTDRGFKGVISGIIRANVLEAALVGVKFVPVTQEDLASQKAEGWAMPAPARFLLSNERYAIAIRDRRSTHLDQDLAAGIEGRNTFHIPLRVQGDAPWVLHYHLPEALIQHEVRNANRAFFVMVGLVLFVAAAAVIAMRQMARIRRSVSEVGQVFSALSSGNLTRRMLGDHRGALKQLTVDSNQTVDRLGDVILQMKRAGDTLETAAGELQGSTEHSTEHAATMVATLRQAAATMAQFSHTIRTSAERTQRAGTHADSAAQVAGTCGQVVGQVVQTMKGINEASSRIAEIISVIDGIAFQTNILALNAAVEAARAGEQGRGFAVVASEVRALAQRSAGAAKEIKDLITDSVAQVETGAALVDQAGATMDQVVNSIRSTTEIMAEVATSTSEMNLGVENLNTSLQLIQSGTEQNLTMLEQMSATAKNLDALALGLTAIVDGFVLGEASR